MILLAFIYVALAVLVCAVVVGARLPVAARACIVVAAPVVAFAVWQAAQPPTGWPATAAPPKNATFVWASIREPDQLTRDAGEIDLWLTPPGATQPRSYRLPYSRQLHRGAQQAMEATRAGARLSVRSRRNRTRIRFVFYRQPPVGLPNK